MCLSPHPRGTDGVVGDLAGDGFRAAQPARDLSNIRKFADAPIVDKQTEFLAFVAHELRNPLAPIRTAAALLTTGSVKDLAWAQTVIDRQVGHMARMIEDLLDVARSKTGKLTLVLGPVDLTNVVEQSLAACEPAMTRRRQKVAVSGLAGGFSMHADAMRLIQIVTNLVENASKFSADGAVVRLIVCRRESMVDLEVADDGVGMDAITLSNVFNPFAQAVHAPGFNKTGLGIGLAIVRQLVESHGGCVAAQSPGVGFGSHFVVTMPITATKPDFLRAERSTCYSTGIEQTPAPQQR